MIAKLRSMSLPQKRNSVRQQKCFFYHHIGHCRWGSLCQYKHKVCYVPKPHPDQPPKFH